MSSQVPIKDQFFSVAIFFQWEQGEIIQQGDR